MRTVRQLLGSKTPEIFAVSPDASVLDAIKLMAEKGVGAVLAMQDARLCGIVSERDYARKVVLQGRSSSNTPVRDIMTAKVVTVRPDGARRLYAVAPEPLRDIDDWLGQFRRFWTPHLDALATELARGRRERRKKKA